MRGNLLACTHSDRVSARTRSSARIHVVSSAHSARFLSACRSRSHAPPPTCRPATHVGQRQGTHTCSRQVTETHLCAPLGGRYHGGGIAAFAFLRLARQLPLQNFAPPAVCGVEASGNGVHVDIHVHSVAHKRTEILSHTRERARAREKARARARARARVRAKARARVSARKRERGGERNSDKRVAPV